MNEQWLATAYTISTCILPAILAITLHEAAHGLVAYRLGDPTARQLGRVTLNPLRHIDPFGTIVLPGLLLLLRVPFVFGYAKPVPVNFQALGNPRRDMIWVAAAGPATNILMAVAAGLLAHLVVYLPAAAGQWSLLNLENAIMINVVLAIFNMIPLPPLDGGRVAVGLLPDVLAAPLARLEPFGMAILLGLLFILPMVGDQLGQNLDVVGWLLTRPVGVTIDFIIRMTGNA
ncbi:site-2 protease family protein [Reyranella sp.]|uniref:site-2 protease family protein n=1 Tax=Reyranella sp. TaxID=1929291 RepID=UPI00272FF20D|nr:site-2 protease family protein [Reyranella sp.]MDP2375433.1 site-2 protease family protein [Reyranella sp.]